MAHDDDSRAATAIADRPDRAYTTGDLLPQSDPETVPATYQDGESNSSVPYRSVRHGEERMAIGVIFNFPGGTTEQYDEVCRELNDGRP